MKRLLCLLLVLLLGVPALALESPAAAHNDALRQTYIDPKTALSDTTDSAPGETGENAAVLAAAREITKSAKTDWEKLEAIAEFVQQNITLTGDADAPLYAPEVLAEKTANPYGITHLTLALCHALDLPAIRVVGRLLDDGEAFDPNAAVNHSWCEVLVQNTWYAVDVTQGLLSAGLPDTHLILRRGVTDSDSLYYDRGFRYKIQEGTALVCGAESTGDALVLNIPCTLGGLPVTAIAEEAFAETEIAALTLPRTLQTIGRKAFFHSRVPGVIDIPTSVTDIGQYAFSYLNGLAAINTDPQNPAYTSVDGVLYSKDMTTLWVYPNGKTDTEFAVPESVTMLYCTCFSGNPYLTRILVQNPETEAMTYTFYGCHLTLYGKRGSAIETRLNGGGLTEYLRFLPESAFDGGSLMHFTQAERTPAFIDVPADAWFYPDLAAVYRQGLMLGLSESVFGVDDTVTLAQAVTMSARIRNRYEKDADLPAPEEGGLWYQPALTLAFENNWFTLPDLSNPDRPATRGEFAQVLAGALPAGALPQYTEVSPEAIPDLPPNPATREAVLLLYESGILAGNPDGRFNPDSTITRAEAAAILARLTDVSRRIGFNPVI